VPQGQASPRPAALIGSPSRVVPHSPDRVLETTEVVRDGVQDDLLIEKYIAVGNAIAGLIQSLPTSAAAAAGRPHHDSS
jgi:hypothetical protein